MTQPSDIFSFGVFELDTTRQELRRNGVLVKLRPQPARLLALLVRRHGELVTRDEIRSEVWGDEVVEFDQGVNSCIRQIRAALNDDADSPRFVQTVPRRGYVFLAEPRPVADASPDGEPVDEAIAALASPGGPSRHAVIALLVLIVAVTAAVLATAWRPHNAAPPASVGDRVRLAVLPLENLTGDASREYLSDGLTEELIFQLARVHPDRLAVIARTSIVGYKNSGLSIDAIGRELGVQYVLEGSVRHDDGRLRVTTQLIRVSDQAHRWADSYDRAVDDLFALQGDIARRVTESLTAELLLPARSDTRRGLTVSARAYDTYLRARFEWNRFDTPGMTRARELFEEALALDDGFAAAWAGLADVHNLMPFYGLASPADAYAEAKRCARAALDRDADNAAAHNALGFALFYHDRDWAAADRAFARAVELDPGYAMARHWYAGLLSARGRHDDAIHQNVVAVQLDPRSLSVRSDLAWYYLFARRFELAVAEARRALAQEPWHGWSRQGLILALYKVGRYEDAVAELEKSLDEAERTTLADALALPPRQAIEATWRQRLRRAEAGTPEPERDDFEWAVRYALAGEVDAAVTALERAAEARDAWVVFMSVDPRLDALHASPRFATLAGRLDLPAPVASRASRAAHASSQ